MVQVVIGEQLGVPQSTISRAIGALTDAIVRALKDVLLTAEEVPEGCDYVVDGTLFPCWSWRNHRELWSGKHGTTGMNVQILVLPSGRLVRVSDPYPGSMHDAAALDASGLLDGIDPSGWIADKGYVGRGDDHAPQEAPQRRTERSGRRGQQEHQPDPPGRKSAPSSTSSPGESSTPTTAAPCTHSNRPSPPHSHSTSSKTPSE